MKTEYLNKNWFCREMAGAVFCSGGAAERVGFKWAE